MYEITWQNLQLMLIDMPYEDYSSGSDKEEVEVIEVTNMEQHIAAIKRMKG